MQEVMVPLLPPLWFNIIIIQTQVMIGVNNRVLKIQECLRIRTIDTEWQVVLLSSEQDKGQLQEDTML